MNFTFQLLGADSITEEYVKVRNETWDWCPTDLESIVHRIETHPPSYFQAVGAVMRGHEIAATVTAFQPSWLKSDGQGQMMVNSKNHDREAFEYGRLVGEDLLWGQGYNRIYAFAPDHKPIYTYFQEAGYETTMWNKVSMVDLRDHSFDQTAPSFEVVSYAEYANRKPDSWQEDVWRLEMDLFQDVPLPEPFKEEPLEDWIPILTRPGNRLDLMYLALDGDTIMGCSQLEPSPGDKTLCNTGLTGVRRQYRRKGVARHLKQVAMSNAKKAGIWHIYADNEANNPMYLLNEELGFRHKFNFCTMLKTR